MRPSQCLHVLLKLQRPHLVRHVPALELGDEPGLVQPGVLLPVLPKVVAIGLEKILRRGTGGDGR